MARQQKWWLVVSAVLVLALSACAGAGDVADSSGDAGAGTGDPGAEGGADGGSTEAAGGDGGGGDEVKFGYLIGVTGDYSPYFEPSLAGAEIAIEEINEAGGVLDRTVELVTADNLSTVEGAVQGFSRLVDVEGVVAIGGPESDGALAILDSVQERQIPTMCPACGTSELDTTAGNYIWRITGSDTDGGIIAAQFARDAGFENVSMLVQNTEGASGPAEVFKTVYEDAMDRTVAADVRFDPGRSSYQSELQQAFAPDPDAVYMGSGHEAGLIIFREWERRGYGGQFFVSPDLVVPPIAELSPALADGTLTAAIPAYDTDSPAYESFAQRYEERTGTAPTAGLYEANQYDQYIALALAIAAAGSTDGPAINEAVPEVLNPPGTTVYSYAEGLEELAQGNDIDFHGASSSLDLNEHGNLAAPVFGEQQIIDGAWQQVRTIELDPELREAVTE
jgi:branched-chain amino acid transport system substrate-binding protein